MKNLNEKKSFQMPHVFVVLFIIMLLVTILTYIIPSGEFERTVTETGSTVVNPDNFQFVENEKPISFLDFFTAVHTGFVEAAFIIGSLLICSGCLGILNSTGTLTNGIYKLTKRTNGKNTFIIVILCLYFAGMNIMGAGEGVYPFYPIVTGIIMSLGYDSMMGAATILLSSTAGFACGMVNMFTTGVSQQIVGLPMFSGIEYRLIVFIVLFTIALTYILLYGKKILKDPSKSCVAEEYQAQLAEQANAEKDDDKEVEFDGRHKLALVCFLILILFQAYGSLKLHFALGQVAAIYVVFALVIAIIFRISPSELSRRFVQSITPVLGAAIAIGLARSIMVLLNQGKIMDTMVYYMGNGLQGKSPLVTLLLIFLFVTAFNFFVGSGSGKAVMMMPIMSPLGKMLGINQQVMVLTYQLGDGITNLLWPGSGGLVACSLCGVDYGKWLKMSWKAFLTMIVAAYVLIVIADGINYGPF